MSENKVLVLLAVYNGQKWLTEQIDSILHQSNIDVRLLISIDLSDDISLRLCEEYAEQYPNVHVLPYGEHFGGAGNNFYRLLRDGDFSDIDYVSFCDQDDIWLSDKLFKAVEKLKDCDCYSSNVTAFWDDGREVLIDKAQPQREWDYLFEAAGPGCTYVFKSEVAIHFKAWLLERYDKITHDITLHDWLIYAFCRHFGYRWFIDPRPMMRYRQHANNQVGTNNSLAAAKKRLRLIKDKWYRNQIVSIAALLGLEDTPVVKYGLMNGYLGNLYLLININKLRRRARDRLALAFFLLFNLF
ncbi:glycosyltransferase [Aeromonas caviae]|uniref:glycosyltransferase n=1 Tax=Aeromonas caviae TaxID=648 RepID=UPI0015DEA156|nr:glycosyltransferase [Aeromonas caviae]QLL89302.1 glycosyltransferase [Aeromonas caviae]